MKKLLSFALYGLITPAVMLSSGAALAQSSEGTDVERTKESAQGGQDATQSTPKASQGDQSKQRANKPESNTASDSQNARDQSRMKNQGQMDSASANGMQASDLIGAKVRTSGDEDVGSVSDLIIDESGQVVAIVVGVGGFLGMGEKSVAIDWDDVTRSGDSEELELRTSVTREGLSSAPEYEEQD